jgi:3-hydroxyisobutyrate dehydrogenase
MKVGFIGLGHLGKTMARRLISQGLELVVWNRTRDKALDLGAEIAENPAGLTKKARIIFLNLFDSEAVRTVLASEDGILAGDCSGRIVIDTTTNHFDAVDSFHEALRQHGGAYLEAPVLGSVMPASQGALTVLVSGQGPAFQEAQPYIEKIGKNIFFLGDQTLATKMKLINNLVLGSLMATLAEAVALGESAGLEKAKIIDILGAGAGNSMVLNAKREKLLREDFSTHFSSIAIYKDLHYLQDLARTLRRPLFTGSVAKELFAMTWSKEIEDLDFSAVYSVLKGL